MTRFQYQMYIGMAHMQFIIANNYQMLSTSKLKHGAYLATDSGLSINSYD